MGQVYRIGLDIAKNVFQVHGVDKNNKKVLSRKLMRSEMLQFFANIPKCLVALEACGGAHYWGRELTKLGHDARLVDPRLVKPFVINNKTDAADAAAICEVAGREATRFIPIKSIEQQDMGAWHTMREQCVKERTALANQIRSLFHEHGFIIPQGINYVRKNVPEIIGDSDNWLSDEARLYLADLHSELLAKDERVAFYNKHILNMMNNNEAAKRLQKVPGIGPLIATAIVAHFGNATQFKNGRQFAACLGVTPREHSSGGKQVLLGISKRGDSYIRKLLIQGARNVMRYAMQETDKEKIPNKYQWLCGVYKRRNRFIASVAQANKTARIVWHILARGEEYTVNIN